MKGARKERRQIEIHEWDFSELASAPSRVQFFASCWEYQREALRTGGIIDAKLPQAWLSMKEHLRPIPTGACVPPFRISTEEALPTGKHKPRLNETLATAASPNLSTSSQGPQTDAFVRNYSFKVNWICSDKEIIKEFSKWLRGSRITGRPDSRGRPGRFMAELWDLAIYRLRQIERLSAGRTDMRLLSARAYSRTHKERNQQFQHFARAKKRALSLIGETTLVFRESPTLIAPACHGRFLWSRGVAMDAMNWMDGAD
jgi:hypothetical protein